MLRMAVPASPLALSQVAPTMSSARRRIGYAGEPPSAETYGLSSCLTCFARSS